LTRPFSSWPLAIALMIATATAASAQTAMNPGMPPPPPPAPVMPMTTPALKTPGPPGVAAIVNGKKILRTEVADEALKTVGPQILNQMILIELINQEALKQHIVISPAQFNERIVEIRQQINDKFPGGMDAYLTQRHLSLAEFKRQQGIQLKVEALVAKTVKPTPSITKYHVRHLLIATAPLSQMAAPGAKPPHTDADALALIAKAQAELKAGKSFVDVANEYTEDPSGKGKGGDLGIVDAKTNFDPAFLAATLKLKTGQVTPAPVKSQFGYHLIMVDSTSDNPTPADKKLFDDAAAADKRAQLQQVIPPYVQGLRAKAKVMDYLTP
jgi:peptidyl-prolyl cis-trans isomerase C